MHRLLLSFFALILSVGLMVPDAEAKRLGGGKSTGMQRESVSQPAASPSAAPSQNMAGAAAAQAPRKNSWLGPVAGLAAGLGLAALASHLGMGEELASIMMMVLLAVAVLVAVRFFMRKRQPANTMQYAGLGAGGGMAPIPQGQPVSASVAPQSAAAPAARALPPGFDAEGFARQAKVNFLRMQAANDAGNLDDLREFTSPEMFAEIQMQMSERGAAAQHTEVMALEAQVIECVEEPQRHVASVRFSGLLREAAGEAPVDFDEIWHLAKPADGSRGWVVAGIQQAR